VKTKSIEYKIILLPGSEYSLWLLSGKGGDFSSRMRVLRENRGLVSVIIYGQAAMP
jgi:hypothetical protein